MISYRLINQTITSALTFCKRRRLVVGTPTSMSECVCLINVIQRFNNSQSYVVNIHCYANVEYRARQSKQIEHCETNSDKSMNDVRFWLVPTSYSLSHLCLGSPHYWFQHQPGRDPHPRGLDSGEHFNCTTAVGIHTQPHSI
jgi:hypothetical protein